MPSGLPGNLGRAAKVILLAMFLTGFTTAAFGHIILNGAGATFPAPLYTEWFEAYQQKTGIRIGYQKVGSGEGLRQILARSVDFGASDAFMTDDELMAQGADLVHIPTCLGAVAVIYNLPGAPGLRLAPETLADIYLGQVTTWSDHHLRADNPGIRLPDMPIAVVSRLDGSGTTFIFTDYLSKTSPSWRTAVGRGKTVTWPVGMRVAKNAGVADMVASVPGSIGYVSLNYAAKRGLPAAALRNRSGYFIKPTLASVSAAGDVALPTDARVMLTDTPVPGGYPISAFTYILVYREQAYDRRSREKAEAMTGLLRWVIHEGQLYAPDLHYAPLPMRVIRHTQGLLDTITHEGRPLR